MDNPLIFRTIVRNCGYAAMLYLDSERGPPRGRCGAMGLLQGAGVGPASGYNQRPFASLSLLAS